MIAPKGWLPDKPAGVRLASMEINGGVDGPGEVEIGSVMGGYRVDAVLGRGGMGVVYRATQLALGRAVALKVIGRQFAADPVFRERFRQESRLAAALDHPNVITIHEAGEDAGRLFVSMRLVDGVDLRLLIGTEGAIDPARSVAIVAQVASALDAAHAMRLVHRDVKPANILLDRRGAASEHAYLSDFGLVKRIGADPALTGSAGWVGSVDYVAPEQVQGGPVDERTDIYALGAVLYTALTGQVPFPRDDTAARLYASVNEPVPSLATVRPGLPGAFDEVVARAMAKDPAARYSSAGDLAVAATRAVGGEVAPGPTGVAVGWGEPAALDNDHAAPPASPPGTGPLASPPGTGPPASTDTKVLPASEGRSRRWRPPHGWPARAGAAAAALVVIALVATLAGAWPSGHPAARSGRPAATVTSGSVRAAPRPEGSPPNRGSKGLITASDVTGGGGNSPPDQYHITIYDLRRSGPYVTLDFGITCAVSPGSCGSQFAFGEPIDSIHGATRYTFNDVGGLNLVDPVGKKEYEQVTDAKGDPYCSAIPPRLDVGPTVHLAWATFAAPPASTSAMDVVFPSGGPQIPSVPITSGPARAPAGSDQVIPASQGQFDRPPGSTDTTGLTLPVLDIVSTVGGPSGNDAEAPGHSTISLNSDVLFDFAKADLTPAAQGVLSTVAGRIKAGGHGQVTVTGYTDSVGDDSVNVPLSQARAQAVVAALTPLVAGTPVTFIAAGDGSANPVAPNTNSDGSDNPAGRAVNRRVTIGYGVTTTPPPAAPAPPVAPSPAPAATKTPPAVDYTVDDGSGVGISHYHFSADSLVRSGSFVVLHLTATCTGKIDSHGSPGNSCEGEFDFAGTDTAPPELQGALNTVAAVYLTDPTTNQVYIVAHDSDTDPLTAGVNPGWPVGNTYPFWLYFPAPPASVHSLTVELPGAAASIANVAITS